MILTTVAKQSNGHFGPKTVRHCIFGTEMSYFFSVGAEVSLGYFGTSAEVHVSDRSAARSCSCIASSPHVTSTPVHRPSRSGSVSRHFLFTKSCRGIRVWLITHLTHIWIWHGPYNYISRVNNFVTTLSSSSSSSMMMMMMMMIKYTEHSDSRFESIHRFILSESIRIDSFCKKIGLSIH